MCNINTDAMNSSDITNTGTGPLESKLLNQLCYTLILEIIDSDFIQRILFF